MIMKQATLCFLINKKSRKILLGFKKIGFGSGKYNGFGGKVRNGESIEEATKRELFEECGVKTTFIEKVAELDFFFKKHSEWNQTVHVFIAEDWDGKPGESDEMTPEWFSFDNLPFERMWKDDIHWLPLVLDNKWVKAKFTFGDDNESIVDYKINED